MWEIVGRGNGERAGGAQGWAGGDGTGVGWWGAAGRVGGVCGGWGEGVGEGRKGWGEGRGELTRRRQPASPRESPSYPHIPYTILGYMRYNEGADGGAGCVEK